LVTNIHSIPDDLDSKWALGSIIHLDTSQLTEVPDVLLRLFPKALELAGNPIRSVPKELFQLVGNDYIGLSYTSISALPENVTIPSNTLKSFNLDGTNVSSIPTWVDKWLTFPGDNSYSERISASGSPYCSERGRIFSGEQTVFTTSTSSRLMDASTANWEYLKRGMACTPTQMYRYPLWVEDLFNALS
jgi:Leucine-rich repeat (LRR) protein